MYVNIQYCANAVPVLTEPAIACKACVLQGAIATCTHCKGAINPANVVRLNGTDSAVLPDAVHISVCVLLVHLPAGALCAGTSRVTVCV